MTSAMGGETIHSRPICAPSSSMNRRCTIGEVPSPADGAGRPAHPRSRDGGESRRPAAARRPLSAASRRLTDPRPRMRGRGDRSRRERPRLERRRSRDGAARRRRLRGGGRRRMHGSAMHVPDALSDDEAGAMPEVFLTAFLNLFRCSRAREPARRCSFTAAAAASAPRRRRCAKLAGLRVIVTAGSREKCARCLAHGADVAINYHEEDFVERRAART